MVKNLAAIAGDMGSVPVLGISPGERDDKKTPVLYLGNPIDIGDKQATVHRVTNSQKQLRN